MLRRAILAAALFLSACSPVGVATRAPAERASTVPQGDDVAYYQRMARVIDDKDLAGAGAIDFARFRRGSMQLHHAADPAADGGLRSAIKSRDLEVIHKAASAILAEDAAHIGAHIILMNLDQDAGHTADAKLHDAFVAGMLRSILASGDGRGYRTAFRVYFVREEYELVRALGGQVLGQALGHHDGNSYDILQVKTKSGGTRDVYFEITELFAEEGKMFGLPAGKRE